MICRVSVVIALLALTACGARIAAPPSALPSFQRVQANSAGIAPSESPGTKAYVLGDGGANATVVYDARLGADGKLYFATNPSLSSNPPPESGEFGSFDFATQTQSYRTVAYIPGFVEETSNGSVWVEEAGNGSGNPAIDRYDGVQGTDNAIPIAVGPFSQPTLNGINGGIAIGADGQLWFGVGNAGTGGNDVGEIDQSSDAVTLFGLNAPPGGAPPETGWLAEASDKNIWATDLENDGVFAVASGGPNKGSATFGQLPQGPFQPPKLPFPEGIVAGADSKIYAGSFLLGNFGHGAFNVAPQTQPPSFTSVSLPRIGIEPGVFAAAPGKVYAIDYHFAGLMSYDTRTKEIVVLPTSPAAEGAGIAVDKSGTPWISCVEDKKACIESIHLDSTWAVFPANSIKLYTVGTNGEPLPPGLLGIGESGSSGPFSVTSSNTKVCEANVIAGFDHNIRVSPVAPGSCTLSITDAHSRTIKVDVTVIKGKGAPPIQSRAGQGLHSPISGGFRIRD